MVAIGNHTRLCIAVVTFCPPICNPDFEQRQYLNMGTELQIFDFFVR